MTNAGAEAPFAIRPIREEERRAAFDVWRRAVDATHDFLSSEALHEIEALVRDVYTATADLVVADCDGEVIGFMGVTGAHIDALFIDPAWFGRGVGRAFIERARRGCGATTVDVNEQNAGAVAFYQRLGYRVAGRSETDDQGRPYPLLHLSDDAKA
ncbi:MAG: acetyltransferase [Pseudomonadota bacterium]